MAHYHFKNQQVISCDTLTVNCSIEPRYSSLNAAHQYRGAEQPLGSDFNVAVVKSSSWWSRDHPLVDLIAIPVTVLGILFPQN